MKGKTNSGQPLRRLLRYPDPLCRAPVGHGPGQRRTDSADRQLGGAVRRSRQRRRGWRYRDPGVCSIRAETSGLNVIFDLATIKTKFASQIMVAHDQVDQGKTPSWLKALVTMGFLDGIRSWKARPEVGQAFHSENTTKFPKRTSTVFTRTRIRFLRSAPTP